MRLFRATSLVALLVAGCAGAAASRDRTTCQCECKCTGGRDGTSDVGDADAPSRRGAVSDAESPHDIAQRFFRPPPPEPEALVRRREAERRAQEQESRRRDLVEHDRAFDAMPRGNGPALEHAVRQLLATDPTELGTSTLRSLECRENVCRLQVDMPTADFRGGGLPFMSPSSSIHRGSRRVRAQGARHIWIEDADAGVRHSTLYLRVSLNDAGG